LLKGSLRSKIIVASLTLARIVVAELAQVESMWNTDERVCKARRTGIENGLDLSYGWEAERR
jgi:hypothetical protein